MLLEWVKFSHPKSQFLLNPTWLPFWPSLALSFCRFSPPWSDTDFPPGMGLHWHLRLPVISSDCGSSTTDACDWFLLFLGLCLNDSSAKHYSWAILLGQDLFVFVFHSSSVCAGFNKKHGKLCLHWVCSSFIKLCGYMVKALGEQP